MTSPVNNAGSNAHQAIIAGSVLPIKRAEELLGTLPGVVAARIIAAENGAVEAIHVLTTTDIAPKQTVRNIESALIAHLGMRVDHRKISVATTMESVKLGNRRTGEAAGAADLPENVPRRAVYFEDVEVRRSRTKGVLCRVTLRKGEETFVGEAEGVETERSRIELAAKAALTAIAQTEAGVDRTWGLEGAKVLDAFEREFVFVGVTVRASRDRLLLTGSCEIKDSPETASVLAVLDATNRWTAFATTGKVPATATAS